jgi:50S ribosomal protein L16 3-hydroxylase
MKTKPATPRRPPPRRGPLLGGLSARQFLRRHWQKQPLLIRGAVPGLTPPLSRARLFALARRPDVESRLVAREGERWTLAHGPLHKADFPPREQRGWTLLVQGVDLHDDAAHALLRRFRFVPDARLDDLMISWASDGGGVGPHVDSYDVFLLQASGRRRWRIGEAKDTELDDRAPLKILRRFSPDEEHVLEAGDMLYLPPGWAHDGIAESGECMTYSIGFRAAQRDALAAEIARRLADDYRDAVLYRDPELAATRWPARIPPRLQRFGADAVRRLLTEPHAVARALGESLSEPKSGVEFDEPAHRWAPGAVELDRRSRMLYDARHVFLNGASYRTARADQALWHRFANERRLDAQAVRGASAAARRLLRDWFAAGWLRRCYSRNLGR